MHLDPYIKLYKYLGYQFQQPKNLTLALTHRSAARSHNERLEFLGDAVLGMVVAKELYQRFPQQPEGHLTRMRSSLVKGETLAEIGKEMGLGELLKLGPGEMKSGGHRRASILADAVEAILGAIYLEAGLDVCETLILKLLASRIELLDPNAHPKDHKTRLQEYLQAKGLPLPSYEVLSIQGEPHAQTFHVSCNVAPLSTPISGSGPSRRRAEQQAAQTTLEKLSNVN